MHMWCLDGIGRDSWDRVLAGFGRLASLELPPERGKKPSPSESSVSVRDTDRPWYRVIVVFIVVVGCTPPLNIIGCTLPRIYRAFGEEFDC